MPFTLNEQGELVEVAETPDRVAPAPKPVAAPPPMPEEEPEEAGSDPIGTLKGMASTIGATAFDAVMAPARALGADVQGRKLLESLVALGGGGLQNSLDYSEEQRKWAEEHPYLHGASELVGTAAGGFGLGRAAEAGAKALGLGRTAQMVAAGTTEGAAQSLAGASEDAYIRNADLTGEQMIAAMGWGALVGGGTGFAMSKAAQSLFGRSGSRGSTPFDSPRVTGMADDVARVPRDATPLDPNDVPHEAIFGTAAYRPERVNVRAIDELGLENADFLRDGMRPDSLPAIREGATQGKLPPVTVNVADDGAVTLADGRHRLLVAGERGEETIRAHVRQLDADGEVVASYLGNVPLKPRPAVSVGMVDEALLGGAEAAPAKGFGERFAEKLREVSEKSAAKAIGARGPEVRRLGLDKTRDIARDVLEGKLEDGTPIFKAMQSQEQLVSNLVRAREETGSALGAFRKEVASYIDNDAPALRPKPAEVADRIEREVIAPLEQSVIPQVRAKANDVRGVVDGLRSLGDDVSLPQLQGVKEQLDSVIFPKAPPGSRGLPPPAPASAAELASARRVIEDEIEATIGRATTKMGGSDLGKYGELKAKYASYKAAAQMASKAEATGLGNRFFSPSDYGVGGAVLAGAMAGGHGGPVGAAMGAAAAAAHHVVREHGAATLAVLADRLAQTVDRKIGKGVDGFFTRAVSQATKPRAANDVTPRLALPRMRPAAAVAVATPLTLFMGKEKDKQKAYRARAAEVLEANADFGARIRNRSEETLGALPAKAPKLAASLVTTATRGAQFLATKLPAPIVNAQSFTPRSSVLPVSDVELHQFARYWAAVSNPLSTLEDLARGKLTPEQVEATKAVYPQLYTTIVTKVQARLRDLDAKGVFIPYAARLQLDLLLALDGGGEPTASPDFVLRFQQMAAQSQAAGGREQGPTPPSRPINISSRLRSGADAMISGEPQ